jgi:hypothetical protein
MMSNNWSMGDPAMSNEKKSLGRDVTKRNRGSEFPQLQRFTIERFNFCKSHHTCHCGELAYHPSQ